MIFLSFILYISFIVVQMSLLEKIKLYDFLEQETDSHLLRLTKHATPFIGVSKAVPASVGVRSSAPTV